MFSLGGGKGGEISSPSQNEKPQIRAVWELPPSIVGSMYGSGVQWGFANELKHFQIFVKN